MKAKQNRTVCIYFMYIYIYVTRTRTTQNKQTGLARLLLVKCTTISKFCDLTSVTTGSHPASSLIESVPVVFARRSKKGKQTTTSVRDIFSVSCKQRLVDQLTSFTSTLEYFAALVIHRQSESCKYSKHRHSAQTQNN